jgi:small subunit ribosomal protein S18
MMNRNNRNTIKVESKNCYFCANNIKELDYKDVILLRKFINTVGKIIPTRRTGTCAKHQRALSKAIKRARILALLPFVAK